MVVNELPYKPPGPWFPTSPPVLIVKPGSMLTSSVASRPVVERRLMSPEVIRVLCSPEFELSMHWF
jgi:hypothetical protein